MSGGASAARHRLSPFASSLRACHLIRRQKILGWPQTRFCGAVWSIRNELERTRTEEAMAEPTSLTEVTQPAKPLGMRKNGQFYFMPRTTFRPVKY